MRILYAIVFPLALFAGAVHGFAMETVTGTVTFLTSQSVYAAFDKMPDTAGGDSVLAGIDPGALAPTAVKAVSRGSVVLERSTPLGGIEQGGKVYIQVADRRKAGSQAAAQSGAKGKKPGFLDVAKVLGGVSGHVSVQYNRYHGDGAGLEYDQPTMYFDLRSRGIAGTPVVLVARFRTRLLRVLSSPGGSRPNTLRTDRLYDLYAEYGKPGSKMYAAFGRLNTLRTAGMGGLDGAVVERGLGHGMSGGVFGGVTPDLEHIPGDRKGLKRGAYMKWTAAGKGPYTADAVVSYIAESAGGRPTTHLLFLENSYSRGSTVWMYGEAEINLRPRGIGMEGEALRNIRAYASYSPVRFIRLSGSWFSYLVQEYKNPNLIIDPVEELRYTHAQTVLPSIEFTIIKTVRISGETLFERTGGSSFTPISNSARVSASNLFRSNASATLSLAETKNNGSNGRHAVLRLSRPLVAGLTADLSAREDLYRRNGGSFSRNHQIRAGAFQNIGRYSWWSADLTRSWGDLPGSLEVSAELGVRFGGR
jgi:hypothetical protein